MLFGNLDNKQLKIKITLIFLFIASLLAISLRMIQAGIISDNFKHILHAHSHIALLGWLFNTSLIIIQYVVLRIKSTPLNIIFWLSQLTFLGMLLSFPFQGYAFASITFSTLYLFCSYAVVFYLFKYSQHVKNKYVAKSLKWSGVYLTLSSLGPFALGIMSRLKIVGDASRGLVIELWILACVE